MFITLYSNSDSALSHRVRFVLAEKKLQAKIIELSSLDEEPELKKLTPNGSLPILTERESIINDPNIIMYYLDERYPSPSLMSSYPVLRAKTRLTISRIDRDWYSMIKMAEKDPDNAKEAITVLKDSFKALSPIFSETNYFMSEDMTLADCALTTLLWRLPLIGVDLSDNLGAIQEYAQRMFERDAFQKSLSSEEQKITQTVI
ncbi:glutathione S-transferase N-terminal domain-containing protein [Francisellaceae bacterium]|nr:glutathione S-transferase N-terminal domain-containing protein [Francisellaceae bacterium]